MRYHASPRSPERAEDPIGTTVRSVSWSRIALEAVTIVSSILLAFAIDTWWDSRGERARLRQHLDAVRSELLANRSELEERAVEGRGALAAARELVRLAAPDPPDLTPDSLGLLLHRTFDFGAANLADEALVGLLAASALDLAAEPDLHAALLAIRGDYETHRVNAAIFAEIRETAIGFLIPVIPVAVVSHNTGSHENTDFTVPVGRVLSDPRFEGHIGNLAVRIRFLNEGLHELLETTDAIVPLLDRTRGLF